MSLDGEAKGIMATFTLSVPFPISLPYLQTKKREKRKTENKIFK
jgi:hypothetical protein